MENSNTAKEAITVGGWYELLDGRVGEFIWVDGRPVCQRVVGSWTDVPSMAERVARDAGTYGQAQEAREEQEHRASVGHRWYTHGQRPTHSAPLKK